VGIARAETPAGEARSWHGGSGGAVIVPTIVDVIPAPPAVDDPRLVDTTADLRSYAQFIGNGTGTRTHIDVQERTITLLVPTTWSFGRFFKRTYTLHITLNEEGLVSVERPWWTTIGNIDTEAVILIAVDQKNINSLENANFLTLPETELLREIADPRAKLLTLVMQVMSTHNKTATQ